ncbi:MAG: hypothetical protein OXF54_21785 [Caldilineaceae bacterium]|uniref:Uncharacterized protein n=1 Tax=Caldilineaceae bacterium SB0675_bin_29 TaxID=2605266 RepID=A0A6B1FYM8_9CHLR|nr:hypothetical protein [Caldilineaceae bacterium]MYH61729.1 hypothetical protein [Caldilineaceae bacterium SB0675_bin_29]
MSEFVVSSSKTRVWRRPEDHPLLRQTDTAHPAFQGKLTERFPPSIAEGLPKVLSENSEDARTWHYFSPLLSDEPQRTRIMTQLIRQSFFGSVPPQVFKDIKAAKLEFWPKLPAPPSRPQVEGDSEPDLLISLGQSAVILVEAKCQSGVSEFTTFDRKRDQVIRLIDVGSWYARQHGFQCVCLLVLQYGDAQINAEKIVSRYAGQPEAIQKALPYRDDLTGADFSRLASALAFVRWPDPLF